MQVKIERVPETGRMEDWRKFENQINILANEGYEIIHATTKYIVLQKR